MKWHRRFASSNRLFASAHRLFASYHRLFASYHRLFASHHRLFASYHRLFASYHRLFASYHHHFTSYHRLFASYHRLFASYHRFALCSTALCDNEPAFTSVFGWKTTLAGPGLEGSTRYARQTALDQINRLSHRQWPETTWRQAIEHFVHFVV